MRYYLVDTSAFIDLLENHGNTNPTIFEKHVKENTFIYLPQFCVVETLNAFARMTFQDKKLNQETYNRLRIQFLELIKGGDYVYVYDLHRYHNIRSDAIIEMEHKIPYELKIGPDGKTMKDENNRDKYAESPLSGLDILVIAMALELNKRIHKPIRVTLLTQDKRMKKIAEAMSVPVQRVIINPKVNRSYQL